MQWNLRYCKFMTRVEIESFLVQVVLDDEMVEINAHVGKLHDKNGNHYGEVTKCVIFHEKILR